MPLPPIVPPLVNSASPWATTIEDLRELLECPSTGAITTRTSLLHGFEHNDALHQYTFFDPENVKPVSTSLANVTRSCGSLNTLGYSPNPLSYYLSSIARLVHECRGANKAIIISVTGSVNAVMECHHRITELQASIESPLCMEINLSCPNIPGKPPPAYSSASVLEYLRALSGQTASAGSKRVAVGIKTPPYTYQQQFDALIDALLSASAESCPIDFITSSNTLGSSLVLDTDNDPALSSASGTGIGGMAGTPLHPLALGNVKIIRNMLDRHHKLKAVDIIGIGGVSDAAGFHRMQAVGAKVVGVGTALGKDGVAVFDRILSR